MKFLGVLALLVSGMLTAQTITGKVIDNLGTIPFANVSITNKKGDIITGTTTNDNGFFELKTKGDSYTIEISFLGYTTWEKEIYLTKNLDLGTILLEENAESLDEITIKTEKRMLERKIDRVVFNVEKSIAATGGNGIDVLKITPGIQVQNNTFSILGKGATQVMINGRLSPLTGSDLSSFLSGFSASDIVKVEVITNPPSKYDASGNGGLINIVLKKGVQNSWRSSTTVAYNQNRYNFTTLNTNLLYRKEKISLSASLNTTKGAFENLEGIEISYPNNFWDIEVAGKTSKDQFSGRFLVDYEVSDNTTFGIQYLGNSANPNIDSKTTSTISDRNDQLVRSLQNEGNNKTDNTNHSINVHLFSTLDSIGRNLSFDADYFRFNSANNLSFTTDLYDSDGVFQGLSSAASNNSNQKIENFSSQMDLAYPIKNVNLSYGIKASFTKSMSDVLYYNTITGNPILDPNRSNTFQFEENVLAAYFSGNTKLNTKLTMQFGVRFEDTKTTGINAAINTENTNNYSKLFPSLYLSYEKNEKNHFGFAYGKRINRPNFRDLNPFRFYINDNSYSEGNPFFTAIFYRKL